MTYKRKRNAFCVHCKKPFHKIKDCLVNKKWWLKQKKYLNRPVYLDSLPRHYVFCLQESIPNIFIVPDTYYVDGRESTYYVWDHMINPYIDGKKIDKLSSSYEWAY